MELECPTESIVRLCGNSQFDLERINKYECYDPSKQIYSFGPCFRLHIDQIRDREFNGIAAVLLNFAGSSFSMIFVDEVMATLFLVATGLLPFYSFCKYCQIFMDYDWTTHNFVCSTKNCPCKHNIKARTHLENIKNIISYMKAELSFAMEAKAAYTSAFAGINDSTETMWFKLRINALYEYSLINPIILNPDVFHVNALRDLPAAVEIDMSFFGGKAKWLRGQDIYLPAKDCDNRLTKMVAACSKEKVTGKGRVAYRTIEVETKTALEVYNAVTSFVPSHNIAFFDKGNENQELRKHYEYDDVNHSVHFAKPTRNKKLIDLGFERTHSQTVEATQKKPKEINRCRAKFYRRFGSVCDPNFNQKVHDAFAIMSYHTVPTGVGFNVVEDRFVTLFRIISKTKNPGHENAAYKTSSKDFFFEDLFM